MAVMPWRVSSPVKLGSLSLSSPCLRDQSLIMRVTAVRRPVRWVPPSGVLMVLAKAKTDFAEAVGVLDGGLDVGRLHVHVDVDGDMERRPVAVEVAHEGLDAALEVEVRLEGHVGALVDQREVDAAREEGHLAEAGGEGLVGVVEHLEDGVVAQEGLDRAGVVRVARADDLDAR